MTGPSPALSLPCDHVLELRRVLLRAAEHLAHGRLPTQILHDLHYNAARLEIALEQGPIPPHHTKEAPR
ncbi:hypothetical protein [Streptomyces sp. NPDC002573]|uniref:hypothetical protein n=1 Tax=Streptomyces sp. NPDC002573 TaxID=3364651 RepID=UPI00368D1299